MSEEEKKAIEYLTNKVEIWKKQRPDYANSDIVYAIDDENKSIQTLLNLIDKKQKEEMNWEKIYSEDQDYIAELNNKIFDLECSIDKQQKEIEELKKPKFIINAETGEVTKIHNDFISKDKIREHKKWYEDTCQHLSKNGIDLDRYDQYQAIINFCEELLEE